MWEGDLLCCFDTTLKILNIPNQTMNVLKLIKTGIPVYHSYHASQRSSSINYYWSKNTKKTMITCSKWFNGASNNKEIKREKQTGRK